MRLCKFCLAVALLFGSLALTGCKPQEKPAETPSTGAADEAAPMEPTAEPLGSG